MVKQSFSIAFDFLLERSILIHLTADVECHNSDPHYVIRNFHILHLQGDTILPALKIKRKKNKWVYLDTEKESHLSEAVGEAIDRFESQQPFA